MGDIRGPPGGFEYPEVVWLHTRPSFFLVAPGPGFSSLAIVTHIMRWINRLLVVRCTAPAKWRRRLRMVVSTLSHCACALLGFFFFVRHDVVGAMSALEVSANHP